MRRKEEGLVRWRWPKGGGPAIGNWLVAQLAAAATPADVVRKISGALRGMVGERKGGDDRGGTRRMA